MSTDINHERKDMHRFTAQSWERAEAWSGRERLCGGRYGRGRFGGHGRFESGFEGGRGGRFRTGRKLASGDLQLVILALLAEAPRHGYEIIKALEERSAGFYAPSPGMVYPALTYLHEIGHASVAAEGARKLYSITEDGRTYLAEHRETADAMLDELARVGAKMAQVRQVFAGEEPEEDNFLGLSHELRQARRALRHALREIRHAPAAEQRRVTGILDRAAAEIRGRERKGEEG
jgi:DNA-binding PadR family transcriptional regulator